MQSLKEQFITYVVGEASQRAAAGRPLKVLDVGCGTARYVPALLQEFPDLTYVGVEPIASSFAQAQQTLGSLPRATVHFQFGYDAIPHKEQSFDLVFSLSVLEHIKHLDRFIAFSSKYVKTGGLMVHRYDLGHALHTHSVKEAIHVWLGNTVPQFLPERQFVRYVGEPEVRALYERYDVTPLYSTYHQMPQFKRLEKLLAGTTTTAITDAFAWEMAHQADFRGLSTKDREHLFPAVAIWGEKR